MKEIEQTVKNVKSELAEKEKSVQLAEEQIQQKQKFIDKLQIDLIEITKLNDQIKRMEAVIDDQKKTIEMLETNAKKISLRPQVNVKPGFDSVRGVSQKTGKKNNVSVTITKQ